MLKEGRCPNCGSIIQLDPTVTKGHCLFCDAVFENKEAFSIAANPAGAVFPNLPQPKYEGPSLDPTPAAYAGSSQAAKASQQQFKKDRKPLPLAYVPKEPTKLPEIKLSPRTKRRVLLISLIVLLIIAAVSVPLIITRDQDKARLLQQMENIAPFSVDTKQAVHIRGMSNSELIIASGSSVSETDMLVLFRNFCAARATVMNIDKDDFGKACKSVSVKLVMPDGGYLIAKPASKASLDDGSAITRLP
jgi:hypothetical protein